MPRAFKQPERRTYCSKYPRYSSQPVEKTIKLYYKKAIAFSPNFPLGWPFGRHTPLYSIYTDVPYLYCETQLCLLLVRQD